MTTATHLSRKALFERDGFVAVPNLLTPEEVAELKRRTDQIILGEVPFPKQYIQVEPAIQRGEVTVASPIDAVRKIWELTVHDELFAAYARHPKILAVVEELIGPDIKLYADQMFLKPPLHGSVKPYHQDSPYWPIDPPALATCWLAMDDATIENGCMRFLPGSHERGIIPHYHLEGPHMVPEGYESFDTSEEVAVELKAGSGTFHHSLTLHQTLPNRSPHPRRAMTWAYMSARSRYTGPPPQPQFPLLRGREYPGCV
jgi:ectoine hydroxylase-related dioxygenase (phytanoyl-CoA dioxygenase family)